MKKVLCALLILALTLVLLPAPAAEAEQKGYSITGLYYSNIADIPYTTVSVGGTCPVCQEGVLYADFTDAVGENHAHHYIRCPNRYCKGYIYERCSGDAPCGQTGYCQVCGNLYHGVHDYRVVNKTDPTCTNVGYRSKCWYCVKCQQYFDEVNAVLTDVVIPARGHDLVHHDGKAPTCAEVGWEAYDTCSRCDYTTYREIPISTAHTPGEPVREEPYLIPGLYDMVTYCTVCGREISRVGYIDMSVSHPAEDAFARFNRLMAERIQFAEPDGVVEMDVGDWIGFQRAVFQALAERPDVSMKVTCLINGEAAELTIPAGFDLLTPLGTGWMLTFEEIAGLVG